MGLPGHRVHLLDCLHDNFVCVGRHLGHIAQHFDFGRRLDDTTVKSTKKPKNYWRRWRSWQRTDKMHSQMIIKWKPIELFIKYGSSPYLFIFLFFNSFYNLHISRAFERVIKYIHRTSAKLSLLCSHWLLLIGGRAGNASFIWSTTYCRNSSLCVPRRVNRS